MMIRLFIFYLEHDRYFKQISVQIKTEFSSLEFGKTFRYGKSQTASFCISRNVSADKPFCQFVCRNIQRLS